MATTEERFAADRDVLTEVCRRVAGLLVTQHRDRAVSRQLELVADALSPDRPWEEQANAAASLRGLFHRDDFTDQPAPPNCDTWEADLRALWDLSTIFVETRYREVAVRYAVSGVASQEGEDDGA